MIEFCYKKNFGYAKTINDITKFSNDYKGVIIVYKDTNANLDMFLVSILFNLKPTSKR